MSDDMILMNPNYDTERLKALEVLQRLRDERERMGIKLEEITLALDRVLRANRMPFDEPVFRHLTVAQVQAMLDQPEESPPTPSDA